MGKNIRLPLLMLVIMLPVLLYALVQMGSQAENERMAEEIYQKQMETVLYSLNTYADDRINQWVRQLSLDDQPLMENAKRLLANTESIQVLNLRQMSTGVDSTFTNEYVNPAAQTESTINMWYASKDSVMNRLASYLAEGYQKIQAAEEWQNIPNISTSQAAITIMLYDTDSTLYNALLILETTYWVEQILGSRMQELAQDNFRLAVQGTDSSGTVQSVYETDPFENEKESIRNDLWILPDVFLSIQSRGISYTEVVKNRSRVNLYILFASIGIMLIGSLLMIRSVRNTVKLAQLKSDFVSNVSHEIRTPLSLIRMYAETLMLGRLPSAEKKKHYYHVIHHEASRLTYLVNNILDFSKIEANKKTYQKVLCDMNELAQKIYENYAFAFNEKNVKSSLSLSPEPVWVEVDELAFDEALSNLIENAIKYSKEKISIDLEVGKDKETAYCKVKDKGIGITREQQKHVFDNFYRVEDALTQKTKGAGLGLSLVKHIVTAHDGSVDLISSQKTGSTFTLNFPLATNNA